MQGRDHLRLLRVGERVEERQAQQAVAHVLSHPAAARLPAEPPAHLRKMQRDVVEDREDPAGFQVLDELLAVLHRAHEHVEHVIRLLAVRRNDGQAHAMVGGPALELGVVPGPDSPPRGLHPLARFELRVEKGRQHVRRQIAGPHVDPGVLVDLAAEEPAAVRALLANDLGALDV